MIILLTFFLSNPKSLDLPAGLYQDGRRTTSTENVPVQREQPHQTENLPELKRSLNLFPSVFPTLPPRVRKPPPYQRR